MKQLRDRVAREDVSENFWFQFFEISNYVQDAFQNIKNIRSHVPKHYFL
jgi:hypothetical protein